MKITLDAREVQYATHVASLVKDCLQVDPIIKKRRGESTVDILVFRKHVVNTLLEAGLQLSPKWNRARIPEQFNNAEFGTSVLRGYMDTDGTVALCNNHGTLYPRIELKIMPAPMQKQLLCLLEGAGMKFHVYDIGAGKIRVQINGVHQCLLWEQTIGFHNDRHIRKIQMITHHE